MTQPVKTWLSMSCWLRAPGFGALAFAAGGLAALVASDAEAAPGARAADTADGERADADSPDADTGRSDSPRSDSPRAGTVQAARAYCQYVTAVADSEGALLRAPWLFSTIGTLRGSAALDADLATGGNVDRELSLRLQAGLGFSPTRYYLAGLLDDQAKAECERHRAEDELRGRGGGSSGVPRGAFEAKIAVLREALPRAEALLKQSLDALEASRTTVQEHEALALRIDGLRERLASAELEAAALPPAPEADGEPAAGSFERLRRWTAEKQAVASRLRRAGALSLTLRGGYDEVFGVAQDVPVFGSVSLEFNPGWFWQGGYDDQAERAHAQGVEAGVLGQRESLDALARRLEVELGILRRRKGEVATALADLAQRRERLDAAGSATGRAYAEYIWFEEVRLRADDAFLRERVRALARLIGLGEQ